MDSELQPPTKRLRATLNRKVQLTECIREFNLPRQFPSMVPKSNNDTSNDKNRRQSFPMGIAPISKGPIGSKIIKSKELPITNQIRTIKLKGKDGRDLGEVNVQDLPHNIQGKTITIAKNGVKNLNEVIPIADKTKGVTVGVLTPINLLKTNEIIHCPSDKTLSTIIYPAKTQKDRVIEIAQDKNIVKNVASEVKKVPQVKTSTDSPGRPQVLVFQSGKSWHMVKIPNNSPKDFSQTTHNSKNVVISRSPQTISGEKVAVGAIQVLKEPQKQNVSIVGSVQNSNDGNPILMNKSAGNISNKMVMRCWSQSRPIDNTDRCKSKSPVTAESSETTRPNIEISRVYGPSSKLLSTIQTRPINEISKAATNNPLSLQKNFNTNKDVMVVLPSAKETNAVRRVVSDNEQNEISEPMENTNGSIVPVAPVPAAQNTASTSAWRRKLLASKNADATKYSLSRDITSARQTEKKIIDDGARKNELTNNLSILEKALSTVEDEVLRAKALKALAECGIGMERLVPVRPVAEQRPVKDSDTQTCVFGLWDPEEFIYVPKEKPGIQRKKLIERASIHNPNIIGNPNSQELYLNNLDMPNWVSNECIELTNMVEGYVKGNEVAAQVADIFAKPSPVHTKVIEQLEKDFATYKKYDENGLLSIHKAVVAEHTQTVTRLLFVLRATGESIDVPTRDGQTSLELAVRYDVSPKIVKLLLDAGAQPTSVDPAHDSALIIASRQSYDILMELIPYVETRMSLDNYDSTGFAALHYCTQNGFQEGVAALTQASADINLRDRRSGRTPLFHAIENDHNDLAQMLLENGAEPGIPNYGGQTIFHVIDESKHYNLLEVLNRVTNK